MKVVLSTVPQGPRYPHKVTIVTPAVELGASSELWDEASLVAGVPSMFIQRESSVTQRVDVEGMRSTADEGVFQRGRSWATIAVETVPAEPGVLEIPLFVSFSFRVPVDSKDEKEPKESTEANQETLSIGFWAVLGVCRVLA